jgi:hypothetical protein
VQNVNINGVENVLVSEQCSETEVQGTQKFKATGNTTDRNGEFGNMVGKIGPRHVSASGCLIICHPGPANNFASLENDVLYVFSRRRIGLANVLRSLAQIADNFRINSFVV